MLSNDDGNRQHWVLDKKVPIALILTLAVQTVTIVWWAATASARLDQLERATALFGPHVERIIRVEEKVGVVQQGITEIKTLLRDPIVRPR